MKDKSYIKLGRGYVKDDPIEQADKFRHQELENNTIANFEERLNDLYKIADVLRDDNHDTTFDVNYIIENNYLGTLDKLVSKGLITYVDINEAFNLSVDETEAVFDRRLIKQYGNRDIKETLWS